MGVGLGPSLLSFIQSHFYADAFYFGGFPDSSAVKNLPAMHLEKEVSTHSSILAWEIPCTGEPDGLQSMGLQKDWTRLSH